MNISVEHTADKPCFCFQGQG